MHISQYRLQQHHNGMGIAIDPFVEEDRLREFFGTNLLSYSILPVFIVAENATTHPVLIQREAISLLSADGTTIVQLDVSSAKAPLQMERHTTQQTSQLLTLFPLAWLVSSPAFARAEFDLSSVIQNIGRKALYDRGMYPGERSYGLIYFKLDAMAAPRDLATLRVRIEDLMSRARQAFIFDLRR